MDRVYARPGDWALVIGLQGCSATAAFRCYRTCLGDRGDELTAFSDHLSPFFSGVHHSPGMKLTLQFL